MSSLRVAFTHPGFLPFSIGNAVSATGIWAQRVTLGWLTWDMTGSGAWLGFIAFADMFPVVLVAPFAGAAADRWNRITVLKVSQIAGFVLTVLLTASIALGYHSPLLLVFFVTLLGSVFALTIPLRMVVITSLLPRETVGTGVAINSLSFNLARFVGPAVAGGVIATLGPVAALVASAATYLIFLISLMRVRHPGTRSAPTSREPFAVHIAQGVRYALNHRGIRALLALMIATGLGARPLVELLPGFAGGVFRVDATGLAALTSAVGAGAIAGGLWMTLGGSRIPAMTVIIATSWGLGAAVLAFAFSPSLLIGVAVAALFGFCLIQGAISIQTSIQLAVDDDVQGRVLSLYALALRGAPAIGAVALGALAEWTGFRGALAVGGVGLLLACSALTIRRSKIDAALGDPAATRTRH